MSKPILLIDMDGVIMDYYGGFLDKWKELYPTRKFVEPEDLNTFYIEDEYPSEYRKDILDITRSLGFFRSLKPIKGAVRAMHSLLYSGHFEPFICTAPDVDCAYQACWTEKARCVEEYFGKEWLKRLIITKDKTLIAGDYLIDDKPVITGVRTPSWSRVVFDHKYNRHIPDPRLTGWGAISLLESI